MEVKNPIRSIRKSQGLTIRGAAKKIKCNYQTLYMVEHGMYMDVLPNILTWALQVGDSVKEDEIQFTYMLFRSEKQDLAREKYSLSTLGISCLGAPGDNPVLKLREYLGLKQSAFCKELCIPIALLYYAENKSVSLPKQLKNIFCDLGIPQVVIDEMICRYELVD